MPASLPRLQQLLGPVVTASGMDLEGLEVTPAGRRSVVRVLVDKDGGATLDDVAEVSRAVSDALDALDAAEPGGLAGAYVLEVGTPGVDRPLTEPRHWRRNVGRLVRADLVEGPPVTGRVLSAAETEVVLDVDGAELRLALTDVRRAQVQVEFTRGAAEDHDELDEEDDA